MAKLMLVEDDNNLREIYEARLQAEGYTIVTAQDGEEALVVAKAEKPDLIVSDVMMPKISGFEMLDILRNTDGLKDVKVIMLTALGQTDDQQRADKLGADRYLVKSQVTLEDIVKVTHELLGDAPAEAAPAAAEVPTPTAAPATETPTVAAPAPAAPAAEPTVVAAPLAAEPAVQPTAIKVTAPSEAVVPPVAVESSIEAAESTAQESADVKADIENFVAGAAAPASGAVAATPSEPPATPATATDNAATDDKLLADAVKTLSDNAPAPASVPTPTATVETSDPAADPTSGEAGSKKVITPIEDPDPKKDLDALLAIEDAKDGVPPVATVPDETTIAPSPSAASASDTQATAAPIDPNSISL